MSDGENGNGAPPAALMDELVLTYDRAAGTLHIGGRVVNADVGLSMCLQAARHFEGQLRVAAALNAQQQMVENARTQRILDSVRTARG